MPPTPDDRLPPGLRLLIGVLLLGGIMGLLDGTMVTVAAETLAADFGTSLTTIGWVSTSYLLALTVTVPITTWAIDRFGGRKLWLSGLAVFLAGSLASGLAWDVGSLITFRVVQGAGAGILDPLLLTLLARAAGPSRTGRAMGLMGLVISLAPVAGPALGGVVIAVADWRWMFLVNLPIGVLAFLGARRVLPADPPRPEPRARLDLAGLALIGPALAVLVLALSQTGQGESTTWPLLALGIALLAGYAAHAIRKRATPALVDLRLFASRQFTASVVVVGLVGLTMFSALFVLPLYYQEVRGHDVWAAGLLVAPFGVGGAVAMPLAGRLSDRAGARNLVFAGSLATLLCTLAFTLMSDDTPEIWPMLASLGIGLSLSFAGAPTMGSLYRTLPAASVPQGSSVLYMLNQLGASVGIAVVALILGTATTMTGLHTVFWCLSGGIFVILALSRLLPGKPEPALTTPAVTPASA